MIVQSCHKIAECSSRNLHSSLQTIMTLGNSAWPSLRG